MRNFILNYHLTFANLQYISFLRAATMYAPFGGYMITVDKAAPYSD